MVGTDVAGVAVEQVLCEQVLEFAALPRRGAVPELAEHELAGELQIEAAPDQVPEQGDPCLRLPGADRRL
jgi:hypothetical protein